MRVAGGPMLGTAGAGSVSELSGVAGITVYVGVGGRGNGLHRVVTDRNTGRLIYRDVAEQQAPVVQDLGLDRVYVYRVNTVIDALIANDPPFVQGALGRGPRHGSFHPNSRW